MSTKQAESYLFHGTQRACTIGEDASHTTTCSNRDCHLCSIIRCSFQLKYIGMYMSFDQYNELKERCL